MKKLALLFVLAVFGPSLGLAWLAFRSLEDQQVVAERQRALLYQGVASACADAVARQLLTLKQEFRDEVAALTAVTPPATLAPVFHETLVTNWPLCEVGFVVAMDGRVLSPGLFAEATSRQFRLENDRFLCSVEPAEVFLAKIGAQYLKVDPGSKAAAPGTKQPILPPASKAAPEEARFRRLVETAPDGMVARFLQDQLNLLVYHRPDPASPLVFGCRVRLARLVERLDPLVRVDPELEKEVVLALLDDQSRPVARSRKGFVPPEPGAVGPAGRWRHGFASAEVGDLLPHWQVAAYLLHPAELDQASKTFRITLGLVIVLLTVAIGVGSWLIFTDLRRHVMEGRRKADFASNVSHEFKTPLTSIRLFSELAQETPDDDAKREHYLRIISTEAARLTRLINNVLDFTRLERGEGRRCREPMDLRQLVESTCEACRPQLQAGGCSLKQELPAEPVMVQGDRDGLSQVVMNLLSNAEKYGGPAGEIEIRVRTAAPHGIVEVEDRGPGVPSGVEERIFEEFFRAEDSLASGIQGLGLGLALARRIARAHGGDVTYRPRPGGGSCFALRLPTIP